MDGFKLLAIRPLTNCNSSYRKNLIEGEIYKFYSDFDYLDDSYAVISKDHNNLEKEIVKIQLNEKSLSSEFDLYSSTTNKKINISAIVGKNGSGKSAIFQLIYASIYTLITKYKIPQHDLEKPEEVDLNYEVINNDVIKNVNVELFFCDGSHLIIYQVNNQKLTFKVSKADVNSHYISFSNFIEDDNQKSYDISKCTKYDIFNLEEGQTLKFSLANFFYSIGVNYSLHGLNSEDDGWLHKLFHKNDGYQTPVVVNPYRYNGNIDINNEYHLTQSRILLNLEKNNNSEILDGKKIDHIEFIFDPNRLLEIENTPLNLCLYGIMTENGLGREYFYDLFCDIYERIANQKFNRSTQTKDHFINCLFKEEFEMETYIEGKSFKYEDLEIYLMKYVIYKLIKLTQNDNYINRLFGKRHMELDGDNEYQVYSFVLINPETKKSLIDEIINIKSHLTLKIHQTIYAIRNKTFNRKIDCFEGDLTKDFYVKIIFKFNSFVQNIKLWKQASHNIKDELNLVPISFSRIELKIENPLSKSYDFKELSSGEQQMVTTLNTIYYHLYNLNSVHNDSNKVAYRNVCILLDEIELYLHPEYQRKFITYLLNGISKLKIRYIKSINILFSTHSPFILSDIPFQNILRIENGNPKPHEINQQTFGANIHDLLANDFFLNEGSMGEFAKQKINKTINWLNDKKRDNADKEYHRMIIKIIGEPILKRKLMEMYDEVCGENTELAYLQQRIEELESKSHQHVSTK